MTMTDGTLIAVDPSLRTTGVAIFRGPTLERAFLVKNPSKARGAEGWKDMSYAVAVQVSGHEADPETLVIETQHKHHKGRIQDYTELAHATGAIVGALYADKYETVTVSEWKGSLPKRISNRRTVDALSGTDLRAIEGYDYALTVKLNTLPESAPIRNVLDAVGIGLYFLRKTGVRK